MAKSAAGVASEGSLTYHEKKAGISKNEQLMEAVRRGELTTVRRLVDKSNGDVCTVNHYGLSCLQLAIIGGHKKLAEFIVQKGANIHSIDAQGWTALHDAAQMDMKELVRKLVYKGCNLMAATDLGELPIDVAGSVEMEKILCTEMALRGDKKLAKDYEAYLGLKHVSDSNRVICTVSHRGPLHMCSSIPSNKAQLHRRHSSPVHVLNRHHHAHTERDKTRPTASLKLQEAVIDRPLTHETGRHHHQYRFTHANINTSRQTRNTNCTSATNSRRSPRRERAERGNFRSSAALSAALGVCFDSVTTAFGEDSLSQDPFADLSGTSSDYSREQSFCEQSVYNMARTKIASSPVSVATTAEKERSPSRFYEQSERQSVEHDEAAKTEGEAEDLDEVDSHGKTVSKEAIANLKRLPRKPSIIQFTTRRRSTDGTRRRSVTFQPEVLLQEMVLDGDLKAVKEILDSGTLQDLNKLSPAGLTALHQSAIDGNLECAKALIASGADVNSTDCELWTPLHAAAMSGQIEIVRYLLSHGANSRLKNEVNETAYDVAKTGPIRKLLLCAMNGKSPDADEISDGEYSDEEEKEYSHMESESEDDGEACYFDSPKTSHENSASPSPDFGEQTDSVFLNGTKTIGLSSSAPTNVSDNQSRSEQPHNDDTTNEFASEDQGISTMDGSSDCSHRSRMLSEDEGTTRDVLDSDLIPGSLDYRFQEAGLSCNVDSLLKLVKHRQEIDINRVNKSSGITALHNAVLEENFAMVQHLVKDFEADLHIKDRDGWTPLHAASAVGDIRIAQFLLDNGAKASILNNQCEFPVDVAEDEAMEKLLKNVMLGPSVGNLLK